MKISLWTCYMHMCKRSRFKLPNLSLVFTSEGITCLESYKVYCSDWFFCDDKYYFHLMRGTCVISTYIISARKGLGVIFIIHTHLCLYIQGNLHFPHT